MKLWTAVAGLALLSASAVTAAGSLGFNLNVRRNSDGKCKQTADFVADFKNIKPYTNIIRVYAAKDCNTLLYLAPALVAHPEIKVFLGVWPTDDDDHFVAEQISLTQYLPTISVDSVVAIIVGTDDSSSSELPEQIIAVKELLYRMKDMDGRSYFHVPVGFADSWENIIGSRDTKNAIGVSNIVLSNAFPYWQGQTQANASYSFFDDTMRALQAVQALKDESDFEFWVGETGWPTSGPKYGVSEPSVENAAAYWQNAVCAIRAWGINTLVFEAYDESWKPDTSNSKGAEKFWGVLNDNGKPKFDLTCKF